MKGKELSVWILHLSVRRTGRKPAVSLLKYVAEALQVSLYWDSYGCVNCIGKHLGSH